MRRLEERTLSGVSSKRGPAICSRSRRGGRTKGASTMTDSAYPSTAVGTSPSTPCGPCSEKSSPAGPRQPS